MNLLTRILNLAALGLGLDEERSNSYVNGLLDF